jgi:hypothetical protein
VLREAHAGAGDQRSVQAEASHAWAELFLPHDGWRGFDPTNGCLVGRDHVHVERAEVVPDLASQLWALWSIGRPTPASDRDSETDAARRTSVRASPRVKAFLAAMVVAAALASASAGRSQAVALGDEAQVNQYTTGNQVRARLATNQFGETVIVWESASGSGISGQDGSGSAVVARRIDSSGQALGDEIVVNEFTAGGQSEPAVAALPGGDFVVVWNSNAQDGDSRGVFGRLIAPDLTALSIEFQVNSYTSGRQEAPVVASAGDGRFLVVWETFGQDGSSGGLSGQLFAVDGEQLGAEFQVNTVTERTQYNPAIAGAPGAGFVVVWDGGRIVGQRFDSLGGPSGPEFDASVQSGSSPSLAMDEVGGYVVAWQTFEDTNYELFARRFEAGGGALGGTARLNEITFGNQARPAVSMLASGDVLVVWQHSRFQVEDDVIGRLFDRGLQPLTGEFIVNAYTFGYQQEPAVVRTGGSEFLVAWQSDPDVGSSTDDIRARGVTVSPPPTTPRIPLLSAWGVLLLASGLATAAGILLRR